eukprot:jgi/Chrpa1/15428/Chrysochromulina_OHIO_Genome00003515-RA
MRLGEQCAGRLSRLSRTRPLLSHTSTLLGRPPHPPFELRLRSRQLGGLGDPRLGRRRPCLGCDSRRRLHLRRRHPHCRPSVLLAHGLLELLQLGGSGGGGLGRGNRFGLGCIRVRLCCCELLSKRHEALRRRGLCCRLCLLPCNCQLSLRRLHLRQRRCQLLLLLLLLLEKHPVLLGVLQRLLLDLPLELAHTLQRRHARRVERSLARLPGCERKRVLRGRRLLGSHCRVQMALRLRPRHLGPLARRLGALKGDLGRELRILGRELRILGGFARCLGGAQCLVCRARALQRSCCIGLRRLRRRSSAAGLCLGLRRLRLRLRRLYPRLRDSLLTHPRLLRDSFYPRLRRGRGDSSFGGAHRRSHSCLHRSAHRSAAFFIGYCRRCRERCALVRCGCGGRRLRRLRRGLRRRGHLLPHPRLLRDGLLTHPRLLRDSLLTHPTLDLLNSRRHGRRHGRLLLRARHSARLLGSATRRLGGRKLNRPLRVDTRRLERCSQSSGLSARDGARVLLPSQLEFRLQRRHRRPLLLRSRRLHRRLHRLRQRGRARLLLGLERRNERLLLGRVGVGALDCHAQLGAQLRRLPHRLLPCLLECRCERGLARRRCGTALEQLLELRLRGLGRRLGGGDRGLGGGSGIGGCRHLGCRHLGCRLGHHLSQLGLCGGRPRLRRGCRLDHARLGLCPGLCCCSSERRCLFHLSFGTERF